ncbi:MAG: dihydrofolate reductase [Ghiorsea sp.]
MISLIWAMDQQRLIGADNQMPWHLPADMAWFREHTLGKSILMGRKTFDSIGKPLPKRRNLILSRQKDLTIEGCEVVHDLAEVAQSFEGEELMVMGGAEIYALAMPFAQRLYCTNIQTSFEGDAWFPEMDMSAWQRTTKQQHQPDEKNKYPYQFEIYQRNEKIS